MFKAVGKLFETSFNHQKDMPDAHNKKEKVLKLEMFAIRLSTVTIQPLFKVRLCTEQFTYRTVKTSLFKGIYI